MTAKKKTKTMKLHPAAGVVVVEPAKTERKTDSGIYLPETSSEEKPAQGRVLAVGKEGKDEKGNKTTPPCKVGDTVIYKKWGGSEVKLDGKEYLFAKFEDIMAVVLYK